ncbi:TetR/AcrR family transcriptional regulator [Azospirillum sp. RWY-5-1]|uniref:TetR/AcrR family transcriptional regulator n=1 Tax=Azospirillum oleiclasticum TaxID=2735135 RepID=A0ABX2T3I1_9PROT|nr:TetR/AcrR family transcriptional regulator [Azospirillum oleiclasticum]NYZ11466.1 TetR/AcrR family transcriptional regulator [Azospirillum oleiclasticum]NYZ18627.1 TetR/AcrR family transcriptional regulator [Azospirillum oleiclasticum]
MTGLMAPNAQPGSKPAVILDAAVRLFLDSGFGNVSMDMVARAAGVSKATLYAHFRSKDELFAAMMAQRCDGLMDGMGCEALCGMPVAEALTVIARRFFTLLLSPKTLAVHRVVLAESHRFPELARAFYESGPAVAIGRLSAFLADADRRGRLTVPDSELAAEQFLGMLKSHLHLRLLLGMEQVPDEAEIARFVNGAVGLFTRGYAPAVSPPAPSGS